MSPKSRTKNFFGLEATVMPIVPSWVIALPRPHGRLVPSFVRSLIRTVTVQLSLQSWSGVTSFL